MQHLDASVISCNANFPHHFLDAPVISCFAELREQSLTISISCIDNRKPTFYNGTPILENKKQQHWTIKNQHRTIENRHWTMEKGHWIIEKKHWTLKNHHWTMDN